MKLLPNFEGIAGGMRRRPWATGEVISDPEASSEQNRMSREELRTAANRATEVEKNMSASVCFWAFRRAAIQSLLLSFACVMEGYGLVLITGFFTFPEFRHTFSCPERPHALIYENCEIDPAWQMGLVLAPMAGQMVGVVVNGWVTEKIGFKKTFLASMVSLTGLIAMIVFATSKWMLFVGLLLCGVPWGVFQTLTTNYASDVCMTPIRAYVTGWTNVAWIVGQLIGAIVQSKMVNVTTEWSYRFPLVLQYIFPIPIFLAALFAQESPWWLVRKSKLEKARKVLVKLSHKKSAPAKYSVDDHLALIQVTNEEELVDSKNGGGTGYGDCFKGVNLRRTEITTLAWVTQNACGSALMAWSPYFFEKAGMARDVAWTFVIVQYGLGLVGTVVSWVLIKNLGRRTIELSGLCLQFITLCAVGIIALLPIPIRISGIVEGCLLLLFTLIYGCTIGPVTYALVSEFSSTRLKSKTINVARATYNLFGVFTSIVMPYMLNSEAWNWGPKSAWFWAAFCLLCLVWVYFRLPEPNGHTYAEMDWLFRNKISARKFSKTECPAFETDEGEAKTEGVVVMIGTKETVVSLPEGGETSPLQEIVANPVAETQSTSQGSSTLVKDEGQLQPKALAVQTEAHSGPMSKHATSKAADEIERASAKRTNSMAESPSSRTKGGSRPVCSLM